jgi:DNA-binding NtrC family response regulator
MVRKGQFREDLYYRLTLCEVRIPPLRERREEIVPLALFLAGQLREEFGKPVTSFERAALRVLERYPFPGNVRELKNILTKVFLFGEGKVIRAEAIREMAGAGPDRGFLEILDSAELVLPDRPFSLAALDRAIIRKTLEKFNGNKSRAAAFLGLKRDQFYGRYREAAEPDGPDTV